MISRLHQSSLLTDTKGQIDEVTGAFIAEALKHNTNVDKLNLAGEKHLRL